MGLELIGSADGSSLVASPNLVQNESGTLIKSLWVEVVDHASLCQYVDEWEDLAADALEPNVFYEPWMLLPAIEWLAAGKSLSFVLVFGSSSTPDQRITALEPGSRSERVLCGFFPLELRPRYKGIPVSTFSLWQHVHCFLCTPLVRRACAQPVLAELISWFAQNRLAPLLELDCITDGGPFARLLAYVLHEQTLMSYVADRSRRGMLTAGSADLDHLPARRRKDYKRKERHLFRMGGLEYEELSRTGDHSRWIEEFLQLEAAGWKGRAGTAMAVSAAEQAFFVEMANEAFNRGRLMMLKLSVEGRAIALKCNLIAGEGSFAFKIAFDEEFSRFSPGLVLEVENIRRFREQNELKWMDSCAAPDHFMINRLWKDRRSLQTLLISNGSLQGDLLLRSLPLLRALKRRVRRTKEEER